MLLGYKKNDVMGLMLVSVRSPPPSQNGEAIGGQQNSIVRFTTGS